MAVYQTLKLTESSYDSLANTSQVKVVWTSQQTGQSHNDNKKTAKYWITANGVKTEYTVSYTLPANTTKTILSKTFTIPHGEDGSGTVTVETWMDTAISAGEVELKKTLTLTPIARASTIGAADAMIEASAIVVVNRKSEQYSHSVAFSFGALSGYVDGEGNVSGTEVIHTATNIPFKLPAAFYAQIPEKASGICTLTCRTYYEGQQIGQDQTAAFTATADPGRCAPGVSGEVVDVNPVTLALTGSEDTLIRYCSTAKCTISAQAKNGASIVSKTVNGTALESILEIPNGQSGEFLFSATDSRGYTTAVTVKKTLIPYVKRTVKAAIQRTDPTSGEARLTVSGKVYAGSLGAVDNDLRVCYEISTGEGVEVPVTVTGQTYEGSCTITGLDYTRSYYIDVIAEDKLGQVVQTVTVKPGVPVFHWGRNDFSFHVPVVMYKNLHTASPMTVVSRTSPTYAIKKTIDGEALGGLTYDATDTYRRFFFRQYAADMDGASARYAENFYLPVPASGLTAQKWYQILTSKTPVTVAQGGTGANTAEQALLNLGGVKLVKLWENASDTSTFAAQTVTLNLSGYAGVFMYFKGVTSGAGYYFSGFIPMGKYGLLQLATTGGVIRQRSVTINAEGITFAAGETGGEADNRYVIPVVIYGMKGAAA